MAKGGKHVRCRVCGRRRHRRKALRHGGALGKSFRSCSRQCFEVLETMDALRRMPDPDDPSPRGTVPLTVTIKVAPPRIVVLGPDGRELRRLSLPEAPISGDTSG